MEELSLVQIARTIPPRGREQQENAEMKPISEHHNTQIRRIMIFEYGDPQRHEHQHAIIMCRVS